MSASADPAGAPARKTPGRARRILRGLAKTLAALVVLLGLTLAYFLHDLDARVRAALIEQSGEIEAKIGRHPTFGELHVELGRTTEIVLRDLVVEGAPGATGELALPLLRVPEARLAVALGPLIRSRGRTVEIVLAAAKGPEITLVRTPTGLSIDDIVARLGAAGPRKPVEVRVSVTSFAITEAKLHLLTLGGGAENKLSVDPITLGGNDLRLDAPSRLSLTAAALAATANINAAVDLAPPPDAPPRSPTAVHRFEVHVAALPVTPVLGWLKVDPSRVLDLAEAELSVDAVIEPGSVITARGSVLLARARIVHEGERGEPTTLSAAVDVSLDLPNGTLQATSFDLGLGEAKAHGSALVQKLGAAPSVESFELEASADASALLPLLPAGLHLRGAAVAGPIALAIKGSGDRERSHASLRLDLHELQLLDAGRVEKAIPGSPVAVHLGADVDFTRQGGVLGLSKIDVRVGEVLVDGSVDLEGLGASPSIKALTLRAKGPSETLIGLAPPSRRPPGAALKGPFTAELSLRGDAADLAGKLALDLGKASVRGPGLSKPGGVPLAIELEGHGSRAGGTLARGALRLGSLSVTTHGEIKGPEQLDLAFEARGSALASLLALAPAAAARLGSGSLDGQLSASGTLRRGLGKTRLDVKASLRDARIRRGVVMLTGAPEATVQVDASRSGVSIKADADLGASSLVLAGLFSKPAGKASRIAFILSREADQIHVREARVQIPGLSVEGLDVSSEPKHLHVALPAAAVSMAALVEAIPLLEGRLPPPLADATLRFALELDADPSDLAKASLHLRGVELVSGLGHVNGSIDLDGLPTPTAVRFQVLGGDIDLGAGGGKSEPFALPGDDTGAIPVSGHIHLDRLALRGQTARALDLDVAVAHARIALDRLHAELLGGTIDADKSWLDVSGVPEIDLHARVADLDLSLLPGASTHELQGRGSGSVDLHGRGLDLDALRRSLTGALRVSLREVRGQGPMERKVTVVNPLLKRLAERMRKKQSQPKVPIYLHEASALFDLGGNKLTLKEPILLRADAFNVRLDGTIGLDGAPLLDGQIDIASQAIAEATKGWLVPLRPIPLRLKLTGDPKELKVELIEIAASLAALSGARENAIDQEDGE